MSRRPIAKGEDLVRRLRAARALAGLTVEGLADRVDEAGLGTKTLGRIDRGDRELRRLEVPMIAEALGVPVQWFYADVDIAGAVAAAEDRANGPTAFGPGTDPIPSGGPASPPGRPVQ